MLSIKHILVLGGASAALTLALGCGSGSSQHTVQWQANGMPRHSDPNTPWWRYQFVYHPREQVYFEPSTHTYFWFENDFWHEGPELPEHFTLDSKLARVVHTWHEKPYMAHNTATALGSPVRPIREPFPPGDFFTEEAASILTIAGEDPASSSISTSEWSGTTDWNSADANGWTSDTTSEWSSDESGDSEPQ